MSNLVEEKNDKKYLKISVSKAKTFKHCKKQFKFSYIDKLPKITRDYHVLGTFCHAVLEFFHQAYINGSKLPFNEELTIAWKKAIQDTKGITTEIKKEARPMIDAYLKKISKEKSDGHIDHVLACEKNFKVYLEDKVLLNGMIDRIQQDDDNILHVADYKTTKNKKYLKNDWFQLLTYCFVMLADNPDLQIVRASYILLRHNFEYITKDFTRDEILKVKDEFLKLHEQISKETEYAANPTALCEYCDYLVSGNCEEGQEYVNNNQRKDSKAFGAVGW